MKEKGNLKGVSEHSPSVVCSYKKRNGPSPMVLRSQTCPDRFDGCLPGLGHHDIEVLPKSQFLWTHLLNKTWNNVCGWSPKW